MRLDNSYVRTGRGSAGATAAQQAAKWGARGSVRPRPVACWKSLPPAPSRSRPVDRYLSGSQDRSASSTIDANSRTSTGPVQVSSRFLRPSCL